MTTLRVLIALTCGILLSYSCFLAYALYQARNPPPSLELHDPIGRQ